MAVNKSDPSTKTADPVDDLRATSRMLFERAKFYWWLGLALKMAIVILDVVFIFVSLPVGWAPTLVAIVGAGAEFSLLVFARLYGSAESLLRKLDIRDLLGWRITAEEIRDLITETPESARKYTQDKEEQYFATEQSDVAQKTFEGIQESAWWSKHIAKTSGRYSSIAVISLVIVSFSVLLISINTLQGADALAGASRLATATLAAIFSLSLVHLLIGYYEFSTRADHIEQEAARFLKSGNKELSQAIKLMNDYHLARAISPPLPSFIWKQRAADLNKRWTQYKQAT